MNYKEYFENIKGKRVAVAGIGISNTPLIKMLAEYGAEVTACDKKERCDLGEVAEQLVELGVTLKLGADYLKNLDHEIIFRSPGIRDDIPEFTNAKDSIITSEMEVFIEVCPAQIFAVTGSDGKTTTTTLIYEMLKQEGYNCHLGGNIGKPLLPEIDKISKDDKVVLELSSFQLKTIKKSPQIAVITNLAPNHLDWHKGMEEYIESKKSIYSYQGEDGILVTNADNDITSQINDARGEILHFSRKKKADIYFENGAIYFKDEKIINTDEILLPGVHNIENYMAAIGAVRSMVSLDSIRTVARTFAKIPHRIEFIRELDGVKYYNDSIASSPTRAIAGLNSFEKKVIMIAGGYDKKIPFDVLGEVIPKTVKKLVLIGATAEKIKAVVENSPIYSKGCPEIVMGTTLQDALNKSRQGAEKGDVIILCPACASFDMFKNFEERGNEFKRLVNEL